MAQDVTAGEAAFTNCQACHDIGEGARNKLCPALNGLDGRKAGAVEGYDNSEANKNSGIVWSKSSFKEYIEDPTSRTKMMFSNKNEQELRTCGPISNSSKMDGKKK